MFNKLKNSQKGAILLITSAFLYSIMPVLIRFLGAGHIPPMSQVFLRYIFAFLSALIYFKISKSKFFIKKKSLILLLAMTIFGYALNNLFFTYGILYTLVSNGLFIVYSYTIITPILGYLVLKEKINKYNVMAIIIALFALILLFRPNSISTWKIGGIFALLCAVGQAFYLIVRKKLSEYSAPSILLMSTFVGVIVLGTLSLTYEHGFFTNRAGITTISLNTWIATILFGIDNFLAWLCMTKGFQYVKSTLGSVLLMFELLFALIFAFIFFGEIPSLYTFIGGLLIVASSILVILKGDKA
jgi:drug/metabolite transporter (DMT)-like permease